MGTFEGRGTSFLAKSYVEHTPASASTVRLESGTRYYNNKSSTTAALTLVLPGGTKGDTIEYKARAAVTALTWKDPTLTTTTANGIPSALTAGQAILLVYTSLGWTLW